MGCHALPQGIFLIQGSKKSAWHIVNINSSLREVYPESETSVQKIENLIFIKNSAFVHDLTI